MKPILLSTKRSHKDLLTYGEKYLDTLIQTYGGRAYDTFKSDLSDVSELFDSDEKIVLINHFAFSDGFRALTAHLPNFTNVKYLLSPYSSYTGLDLQLLKRLGIRYRNNSGANAVSVAQYAIAAMLSLLSRFPELGALPSMPDGSVLGEEYQTKTAGIIGMGNVGKELLTMLHKLGIPAVYYNRTDKSVDAPLVSLEQIFDQDIVFIAIATNPDSRAMLSDLPSHIQPKTYLIDISAYDDLYDKKTVVDMLNAGNMSGYALETEQTYESTRNLIRTPHIAAFTKEAKKRTVENYLKRAILILEGKQDEIDFIV